MRLSTSMRLEEEERLQAGQRSYTSALASNPIANPRPIPGTRELGLEAHRHTAPEGPPAAPKATVSLSLETTHPAMFRPYGDLRLDSR